MPAVSKSQQHFMGMQIGLARAGKPHKVSEKVAKEFASTKTKDLPEHKMQGKAMTGAK